MESKFVTSWRQIGSVTLDAVPVLLFEMVRCSRQMNHFGLQVNTNHIAVRTCKLANPHNFQTSWRSDGYYQTDQNSLLFIKRPPDSDAATHKILVSCSVCFILPRRALINIRRMNQNETLRGYIAASSTTKKVCLCKQRALYT